MPDQPAVEILDAEPAKKVILAVTLLPSTVMITAGWAMVCPWTKSSSNTSNALPVPPCQLSIPTNTSESRRRRQCAPLMLWKMQRTKSSRTPMQWLVWTQPYRRYAMDPCLRQGHLRTGRSLQAKRDEKQVLIKELKTRIIELWIQLRYLNI